jgi:hypothetical protein
MARPGKGFPSLYSKKRQKKSPVNGGAFSIQALIPKTTGKP